MPMIVSDQHHHSLGQDNTSATASYVSGLPFMMISTGADGLLASATQQDVCGHRPGRIESKRSTG